MSERNERYGPWVPDGVKLPEVGDEVVFRMGERGPLTCPNCDEISDPKNNSMAHDNNGKVVQLVEILPAMFSHACGYYGFIEGASGYIYGCIGDSSRVHGFAAAALELSPLDAPVPGARFR